MTYLELYEDALRKLHNSLITLGEFETMVKPLNREVEAEPKSGKWNRLSHDTFHCTLCGRTFIVIQGGDAMNYCPDCGADCRGDKE